MTTDKQNGKLIVKRLRDLHLISCMADMTDSKNETLPGVAADYIEHLEALGSLSAVALKCAAMCAEHQSESPFAAKLMVQMERYAETLSPNNAAPQAGAGQRFPVPQSEDATQSPGPAVAAPQATLSETAMPVDPESEAANPVWDLVIAKCHSAYPERENMSWGESPLELITEIINDRDEWRAVADAPVSATRRNEWRSVADDPPQEWTHDGSAPMFVLGWFPMMTLPKVEAANQVRWWANAEDPIPGAMWMPLPEIPK